MRETKTCPSSPLVPPSPDPPRPCGILSLLALRDTRASASDNRPVRAYGRVTPSRHPRSRRTGGPLLRSVASAAKAYPAISESRPQQGRAGATRRRSARGRAQERRGGRIPAQPPASRASKGESARRHPSASRWAILDRPLRGLELHSFARQLRAHSSHTYARPGTASRFGRGRPPHSRSVGRASRPEGPDRSCGPDDRRANTHRTPHTYARPGTASRFGRGRPTHSRSVGRASRPEGPDRSCGPDDRCATTRARFPSESLLPLPR
jgi:hypothetical protein